ncbi:hypothetical protein Pmani_036719 [Petrolisthes manimaculis]|uniref:Uncharacterized protein n=1 Tax=Petrolisthes manimaculis TaxID=1843537 RepID=A0AAE1TME7_9EUCA|nr:hypothetical protein Pmani_036719 [Petrolisthes manimaculis]
MICMLCLEELGENEAAATHHCNLIGLRDSHYEDTCTASPSGKNTGNEREKVIDGESPVGAKHSPKTASSHCPQRAKLPRPPPNCPHHQKKTTVLTRRKPLSSPEENHYHQKKTTVLTLRRKPLSLPSEENHCPYHQKKTTVLTLRRKPLSSPSEEN